MLSKIDRNADARGTQGARTALVVDGYSTGNSLPPAFARLGVDVVHVQSTERLIPSMLPPDLTAYRANLVVPDTAELAAHRPCGVVAGSEYGVPAADLLAERLGLAGNGSALSPARRDKYRMIETLRAAGVRCARQFHSADPSRIVDWGRENGYPVVVKPHASASTQNVLICPDEAAVARAAQEVLTSVTMFGEHNSSVLVQSYLDGTEYAVNVVSSYGRRYWCGVWEYEKTISPSGRPLYDRNVLVDPDCPVVTELTTYVDTVLDALGAAHGPAHVEVIITSDGPTVVEVATRLDGNMNPDFEDLCVGTSQSALTALACVGPAEFVGDQKEMRYRMLLEAAVHNTSTELSGVVESVDDAVVAAIEALPTVRRAVPRLTPGQRLRPTTDLLTSPLRVFMAGTDQEALRADHKAIADLKDQVYRLART